MLQVPEWQDDALCLGQTDLMYSPYPSDEARAKAICATCTVKVQCLAAALEHREPDGVWGGLTTRERRLLLRTTADEIPATLHKIAHADRSSRLAAS